MDAALDPKAKDTAGANWSVWFDRPDHKPVSFPKLQQHLVTEVCIIGGGIAGLSIAYNLAKNKVKVVLLEDGDIASGETGRTTAHLSWAMDSRYYNLRSMYGLDGATMAGDSHKWAVDEIEQVVKEENLDCNFQRLDGFLIDENPTSSMITLSDELKHELDAVHEAGLKEVDVVKQAPLPGIDSGFCLRFPQQGAFDPLPYCYGLAAAIVRMGGQIFTGTRVADFKGGDAARVTSKDGFEVRCQEIVMATNAPLQLLNMMATLEPYRTYVVGAKVPKDKYKHCLIWDTKDPYHYLRFVKFDENHDVIICGGEDHMAGMDMKDQDQKYERLEKWTRVRYPDVTEFQIKWSGQVLESSDYLAYIGRNQGGPKNLFVVTGDSGQGMTHGTIAGKLISDLIRGRANPWEKLYCPSRNPIKSIPEKIKHLLHANLQYKDYLQFGDVRDIEDIPIDCGAIVRKGLGLYAVYKDENGKVFPCSAICTHLKGVVRWNKDEKSWDCPVHGSRFDRYGAVSNGPAKTDLNRVDQSVVCGHHSTEPKL